MAKLILTFKGKELQSVPFEGRRFDIGRDQDNDLQIESLAVAPHHASISAEDNGLMIRQLNPSYPLIINGRQVLEHRLVEGDRIGVGKHEVFFSDRDGDAAAVRPAAAEQSSSSGPGPGGVQEASLQVLKGKNIGLVIPLRRAMTRIGTEEMASAVIARRRGGYFLSALVAASNIEINHVAINDASIQLNHGDIVKVGRNVFQFYNGEA